MHWASIVTVKYLVHVCLLQLLAILAGVILRLQLYCVCCSISTPLKTFTEGASDCFAHMFSPLACRLTF